MERNITCKICGHSIPYKPLAANFIIFCSQCKAEMFLECEYGYGPVTPCQMYYRDRIVAEVNRDACNKYILTSPLLFKTVQLENTYLDALQEAQAIIQKLL